MAGRDEQLCQKPQIATDPTQRTTHDLPLGLDYPHAIGIIVKAEQLEIGRPHGCHRPETVSLRQVVDAAHDKLLRSVQFVSTRRTKIDGHWGDLQ